MHPILEQLYKDHHQFQRLLYSLQKEVGLVEHGEHAINLPLILVAMEYFQGYPERWHHPVEEVIFKILRRKIAAPACVIQILKQHGELEALAVRVQALFNAPGGKLSAPVQQVIELYREFIALMSGHIDDENQQIYPLIERNLSAEDWAEVEKVAAEEPRPGVGEALQSKYQRLYNQIISSERSLT
jgi:hemerythrin-like domain-containing protein